MTCSALVAVAAPIRRRNADPGAVGGACVSAPEAPTNTGAPGVNDRLASATSPNRRGVMDEGLSPLKEG